MSPTRVVVSGHSLGAALATIAGPWAALTWPAADVRVVTFGAPLTGNEQFAEVRALPCCTGICSTLCLQAFAPQLPCLVGGTKPSYRRCQ